MRLTGLRVVGTDGRPIGLGAAVLRWVGIVISAAVVLLGLVWVAIDQRKQGWHDKLAGTVVLRDGGGDGFAPTSGPIGGDAARRQRPIALGLAAGLGFIGSSLACLGIALALKGDAVVRPGPALTIGGIVTLVAILGAVVAWRSPAVGGVALLGAAIVVALAVGPLLGPWYDGLIAATAAGPAAENGYWSDAPAMALLFMAGLTLGVAGLLALAGAGPDHETVA